MVKRAARLLRQASAPHTASTYYDGDDPSDDEHEQRHAFTLPLATKNPANYSSKLEPGASEPEIEDPNRWRQQCIITLGESSSGNDSEPEPDTNPNTETESQDGAGTEVIVTRVGRVTEMECGYIEDL